MYTEQNAPPFSPHPHTPQPPMNLLWPILYKFSPWVTRHFPGWFKWGFKEYWKVRFSQMTKVCWDSQTLFDCWTDLVAHLLLLKSSMPKQIHQRVVYLFDTLQQIILIRFILFSDFTFYDTLGQCNETRGAEKDVYYTLPFKNSDRYFFFISTL